MTQATAIPARKDIRLSFEFFPPKSAEAEGQLWETAAALSAYDPGFMSVTYGAGGSTKLPTLATVRQLLKMGLPAASHLTCVGATKEEVNAVVADFQAVGVKHFVALRGDPPGGVGTPYQPHPGGYANAAELTAGLRGLADFEISVSAYPEKHPQSPDVAADVDMLKRKVDAGATRADPILLRERRFRAVSRACPQGRHHHSCRAGYPAGAQSRPGPEIRRALWRQRAHMAGRPPQPL